MLFKDIEVHSVHSAAKRETDNYCSSSSNFQNPRKNMTSRNVKFQDCLKRMTTPNNGWHPLAMCKSGVRHEFIFKWRDKKITISEAVIILACTAISFMSGGFPSPFFSPILFLHPLLFLLLFKICQGVRPFVTVELLSPSFHLCFYLRALSWVGVIVFMFTNRFVVRHVMSLQVLESHLHGAQFQTRWFSSKMLTKMSKSFKKIINSLELTWCALQPCQKSSRTLTSFIVRLVTSSVSV